jgi:O-antigen/teichoic acid export membrane protein
METMSQSASSLVSRVRSIMRPKPGNLDTSSARSKERYRRAVLTGASASLSKIISMATSILTVRLTFQYLGAERYGMWMTITSIVMMLGFADLGMSNGLINIVAYAIGREDWRAARRAIASAFWMLSSVAAIAVLALAAAYPFIDTSKLFNVHSSIAVRESGPALFVFFLCFAANLPLGTVRSTQTGMQNAFVNNIWGTAGTVASLIALLLAIHLHAGLPLLVLSLAGPPVLVSLLNGVELFGLSHPELLPTPGAFSRESASRVFRTGVMFLLLQISFSVGMQTDNVVIAQIMGAKSVADYAVPARMFGMINAFLIMVSGAMWPAYADAMARSDWPWIRKSFMRVVGFGTAITVIATAFLVYFGNKILAIWVGPQMHASPTLLAVFAIQCILYAYLQPINFLMNGIGKLRVQVISGLVMAFLNLALSIVFVKLYGIVGAVLGTVISQSLVQVVPLTAVTWRELKKLGQMPRVSEPDKENA